MTTPPPVEPGPSAGPSPAAPWTRVNPNPESTVEITARNTLRMKASARGGGSDFSPGPNNSAPPVTFQGAGVVVCFDPQPQVANCWRIVERQFWGPGQIVNFSGAIKPFTSTTTYLRVQKRGATYNVWYSADGRTWIDFGTRQHGGTPTFAGVMTLRLANAGGEGVDSIAEFDYVRVTPP